MMITTYIIYSQCRLLFFSQESSYCKTGQAKEKPAKYQMGKFGQEFLHVF